MKCTVAIIISVSAFAAPACAQAQISQQIPAPIAAPGPFTTTLSNTTPLVFGMSPEDATMALGTPLVYVEGKPGNEVFITIRNTGSSGLTFRNDPLFLQFRNGHLTGWKADWSRNWMWK